MTELDLYYFPTPNNWKITIACEELGQAYRLIHVDLNKGEQHHADFLRLGPNNKVPVILDPGGVEGPIALFESGAILTYLAEKHARLLGMGARMRARVMQWLFWASTGHTAASERAVRWRLLHPDRVPAAIELADAELARIYRVLERRLKESPFMAGEEYTIADIACWPWAMMAPKLGIKVAEYPALRGWFQRIAARQAVKRGIAVSSELPPPHFQLTEEEHHAIFGNRRVK